jgi:pterin-4a-carbinolamine dehydratase
LDLWTHTVNGLSENDYILAAKLDQSYNAFPGKR